MKNYKRYLITFGSIVASLALLTFLLSFVYYFDWISTETYKVFKISILVITLILNSIFLGRNSIKNGYMEGIKLGVMLILFCTLVSISSNQISIHLIVYNVILLACTTLGGMIGINTKKKKS